VAGGGVGGLTAALCMLRAGFDVTVYEKTAAFARFGGPIQFASNALSVLKAIDDTLFERIMDKFTFTGTRTCGIKDGLRADGSFRMTGDSLDYLFNKDAPADWFVKFPLKQCADLFGLPYTGVVDRPDLQEILIDECRKINPDFIQNGNSVISYENLGKGKGVRFALADGSVESADLLVGSDGIWSAIRAQMYGEGEVKQSTSNKKTRQGCPYSGYTVFAGACIAMESSANASAGIELAASHYSLSSSCLGFRLTYRGNGH
jgi:zeaxanthin epoxidase